LADIVYVEQDYVDTGYLVYTATAGAVISVAADMGQVSYATAGYLDPGYIANLVQADQVIASGAQLAATTATVAQARRTRSITAQAVITSNAQITGQVTISAGAVLASTGSTLTVAAAQLGTQADLQVTSLVSTTGTITHDAGLALPVVTWDQQDRWDLWFRTFWDPTTQTGVRLPAYTALAAAPRGSRDASLDAVSVATFQAQPTITRDGDLAVTAFTALTCDVLRLNLAQAQVGTTSTVTAEGTRVIEGVIDLAMTSSAAAVADRQRNSSTVMGTIADLVAAQERIREVMGELSAFNAVLSAAARTRGFGADLTAVTSVSAAGTSTAQGQAQITVIADLTALSLSIAAVRANLDSAFAQSAQPTRILPTGQANMLVQTAFSILAGLQANAQANLLALDFVLATGRRLPLVAPLRLRVASETRQYPVLRQVRMVAVPDETRLNMVLPESRVLTVPEETRIYTAI